ncbi:MAG TPA: DUF3823 domain-containing protein [Bacteroidales bacterium]|nr:DUF3823 domain-containing protein [Bacteroidales bacterium]
MMKTIYFTAIGLLLLTSSCLNDLDNYDAPNGGIYGTIIDDATNKPVPLPVQGSTGVMINLTEQNTDATRSVDFYAKYDGTYANASVFNADYTVKVNGPFVQKAEQTVKVSGQTKLDFRVVPYSRINATAQVSGKVITITYSVEKTDPSFVVSEVYGLWNFAPGVDNGTSNQAGTKTVSAASGTIVFDLAAEKNYNKSNIQKIAANGNKIYLRVGAKTNNAINYSEIITVQMN